MEYYSAIKNEIMPFSATWIDLEIIILSEVSQKEQDKFHMTSYLLILKHDTNGASQVVLMVKSLPANVGDIRDAWQATVHKVLLYSTGNYIQYPVINHNGKE